MIAEAADWIIHSVAGATAGAITPWSMALAFIMGFGTHVILDLYFIEFKSWPIKRYWWWLVAQIVVAVYLYLSVGTHARAGLLGGLAPDIIEGLIAFLITTDGRLNFPMDISRSRWMSGKMIFWFHKPEYAEGKKELKLPENIGYAVGALIAFLITFGGRKKE